MSVQWYDSAAEVKVGVLLDNTSTRGSCTHKTTDNLPEHIYLVHGRLTVNVRV